MLAEEKVSPLESPTAVALSVVVVVSSSTDESQSAASGSMFPVNVLGINLQFLLFRNYIAENHANVHYSSPKY